MWVGADTNMGLGRPEPNAILCKCSTEPAQAPQAVNKETVQERQDFQKKTTLTQTWKFAVATLGVAELI